jgi:hypothetical protein
MNLVSLLSIYSPLFQSFLPAFFGFPDHRVEVVETKTLACKACVFDGFLGSPLVWIDGRDSTGSLAETAFAPSLQVQLLHPVEECDNFRFGILVADTVNHVLADARQWWFDNSHAQNVAKY